jgi:hypothetical protein
MIEATVRGETEGSGYGTFRFLALPSPGDRVVVASMSGAIEVLTVKYIEHRPARFPPTSSSARAEPEVTICVAFHHDEWIE